MSELSEGARNAVRVCMNVGPDDRVVVLSDRSRRSIGEALDEQSTGAGAASRLLMIEDFTERPAREYPTNLRETIEQYSPSVSFFAAGAEEGELAFRRPYMDHMIYQLRARHGHMVGIEEALMTEGMAADYHEIARITEAVNDIVSSSRLIEVTTAKGTDLRATFDPSKRRWRPCPGLYHSPGDWGNLPEGETFTSPISVDGIFAAEVLGDHFSSRFGILQEPVLFQIEDSRVKKVETTDERLRDELGDYLSSHPESGRVGEYAIGTNTAIKDLSGNLLQDEKIPGVHIAFGYPYPKETGADWDCPTHLDVVATSSTIAVDGKIIMRDGVFDL